MVLRGETDRERTVRLKSELPGSQCPAPSVQGIGHRRRRERMTAETEDLSADLKRVADDKETVGGIKRQVVGREYELVHDNPFGHFQVTARDPDLETTVPTLRRKVERAGHGAIFIGLQALVTQGLSLRVDKFGLHAGPCPEGLQASGNVASVEDGLESDRLPRIVGRLVREHLTVCSGSILLHE